MVSLRLMHLATVAGESACSAQYFAVIAQAII